MSDRHQILNDQQFWSRLEFVSSGWIEQSNDERLKGFWIDGFIPEAIKDTRLGVDVEGTAWVGNRPQKQWPYRFIVSLPQKMLHKSDPAFQIDRLRLDERQQTLQITVVLGKSSEEGLWVFRKI